MKNKEKVHKYGAWDKNILGDLVNLNKEYEMINSAMIESVF